MKKYKKIAYIVLIIIILLSGFFIYKVFAKNGSGNDDVKSKSLSEVKFLEDKFLNLFNEVNNIKFENYKISATKIKEQNNNQSSNSGEAKGTSGSESSGSESSGETGGGKSAGEGESAGDSKTSQNNNQYSLKETGILTKDSNIDWNQMKNDVEDIYTSLYTMTLDLYQTSTNQQDIINFNKEFDNLTLAVKNENKQDTLVELSKLYDYLSKFVDNCTDDEKEKAVVKTKNDIFKAYSVLEQEEWATISENINTAIKEFTKLITDVRNQDSGKQYNINKAYVMMNELQNAVLLKDKDIFLIKYKNLLEELQNI